MKKVTLILISIIYIASIILISVFGMKSVLYITVVSVRNIVCTNQTDTEKNVDVRYNNDIIMIRMPFTGSGDYITESGTMLQLEWHVYPDNASNKEVKFVYDKENPRVNFFLVDQKEVGLILFSGKTFLEVQIMATDGSRVFAEINIHVY